MLSKIVARNWLTVDLLALVLALVTLALLALALALVTLALLTLD